MGSRCFNFHKNVSNFAKTLNHARTPHVVHKKLLPTLGCRAFSISSFKYIERRPDSPRLTESYYHVTSESHLQGITVGNLLQETVEKFPDRECLVFCDGNHRRTFAQFMDDVDNLAAGLLQLGLKKGDRVGIWGPNTLEWVTTQFATARMGAILVNVNPAYQTHEMEYALRLVGCKALVASASYKTQNYYDMIREVAPDIEHTQPGHLSCKTLPDLKTIIMISDEHFHGTYKFQDVMSAGGPREVAKVHNLQKQFQFDDAINIQFTSGTTGHPKGATLSHHNIVNNAYLIGNRLGYDDGEDRICCQVPLYHCFGMVAGVMCMATHGATNIFPITGYDPEATVKCLQNENCTAIYGTPTMFIDVCSKLDSMDVTFPTLKKGIMAGSPCPSEVINRTDQLLGTTMQIAYGSTETSPVTSLSFRDDPPEKRLATVGSTLPHTENKLVDPEGKIVPVNEPGEIMSRGYCVMLKYWGNEEQTAASIDESGWYRTGDIGQMDEDGYIKVIGRIKDMIIRGGENVYPTEVEDFIHTHPKVDDVQVIGLPDKRLGEEIGAWIKLKQGEFATEQEIRDFCKGNISHFKIPKYIKFVEEYPITVTRKVQKFVMRKEYAKELGLE
uniref:Medium-chain acyl-CoA ligase ACSF2, mitochondrial n=1 Tax=Phallusia mammillata TaxID=59560 RepID=A0A6F9D559_9ASCI|nr:acyl-CoA synthetase family member 2, mitochondrial-like [Phallusia mammillata]